ncbi:hypothetical protein DF039_08395 [Burkholderia cenocepacia]|nr:hypothetical protein DF039_08395 [Burkholderia cenocepacia]
MQRRRARRTRLQRIARDPYGSFDPGYPVGWIIGEGLDAVGIHGDARRRPRDNRASPPDR